VNTIINGPKSLLAGFQLLSKSGIRLYVIIPLTLNSLLFGSIIFFGAHRLNNLIDWLTSNWTWTAWMSWLLWPLFALIALTIVFFCFSILANLIAAPFNGFLAQAVATHLRGKRPEQGTVLKTLPAELLSAFKSESVKLVYFIVRAIPLLLLFFIPFVQAFAPIIWFLFGAWMLALEYMEYPMSNEGMLFPEVRSRLSETRALTFSFGSSVMLLTMIPVVNFVVMPAAVAAATKIWIDQGNSESKVPIDVAK
jgi:CysZ protein